jgi:hypothetical protein
MPSNRTAAYFQIATSSVQQVGITVIVISLVVQFVAKKVITFMWIYYCALQIIILFVQRGNMFVPSSVEVFINSISGIINLSSLDK